MARGREWFRIRLLNRAGRADRLGGVDTNATLRVKTVPLRLGRRHSPGSAPGTRNHSAGTPGWHREYEGTHLDTHCSLLVAEPLSPPLGPGAFPKANGLEGLLGQACSLTGGRAVEPHCKSGIGFTTLTGSRVSAVFCCKPCHLALLQKHLIQVKGPGGGGGGGRHSKLHYSFVSPSPSSTSPASPRLQTSITSTCP